MQLIHERNDKGQHRIIQLNDDSTSQTGDWTDEHTLATLGKYLANAGAMSADLPVGIFTTKDVPHQVLC